LPKQVQGITYINFVVKPAPIALGLIHRKLYKRSKMLAVIMYYVMQAQMHPLHNLGNANTEANYHEGYLTFIENSTANGAASNAYLTTSYVPLLKQIASL
jgi:hypothetical protein